MKKQIILKKSYSKYFYFQYFVPYLMYSYPNFAIVKTK